MFPFKTCLTKVQLHIVMASEVCYATAFSVFCLVTAAHKLTVGVYINGAA